MPMKPVRGAAEEEEWKVKSIPADKANSNRAAIATLVVMGWASNTEFDSF